MEMFCLDCNGSYMTVDLGQSALNWTPGMGACSHM